jgi:D-sedoheptulose 7-phosphate isomerase
MEGAVDRFIERELAGTRAAIEALHADGNYRRAIADVAGVFVTALHSDNTLLFAGNGGSAADAQHIAGELVSRFLFDRPGLRAVALSTDTSILTSIGNDYGYDYVFARQIEALGRPGDIFVGISTSGNSPNILAALEAARKKGLTTVGLTGGKGGKMIGLCDHVLCAPASSTPRIQECHLATYHLLCALVEEAIFGNSGLSLVQPS